MSGADRDRYDHLPFKDRCARAWQMRRDGVSIDTIVFLGGWADRKSAYTAISRAKKPEKYLKSRRTGRLPGPRFAFKGSIVGGKPFVWDEWDDTLISWVNEGLTRPEMAWRLSKQTGRNFTTNQVIGRIYRIRQRIAKQKSRDERGEQHG